MNMAFHKVQEKDMSLLVASDVKPRLKWTQELHQQFVEAVHQLGGPEKATPKSLMRVMGIHGLTLYHLKSHLQKYRLGKSECSTQSSSQNKREDSKEDICNGTQEQIIGSPRISQALQIQMEVQRKLQEHIEVQKHLQLRIEAQGKYLQSVSKIAEETLAKYRSSSIGTEAAKTDLSQLVSLVDTGCNSSSLSLLTETQGSLLTKDSGVKRFWSNAYSPESNQTSSNSSGLMEMHPEEKNKHNNCGNGIKRSRSMNESSDGKESRKIYDQVSINNQEFEMLNFVEPLDLNRKCLNGYDEGPRVLDLNCSGV